MSESYTSGLNFSWPRKGDTNWDTVVQAALAAISSHTHAGGGTGTAISTSGLAADSITGTKVRLDNAQALRGRNAANSADISIAKVDTSNVVEFPTVARFSSSETITAAGTVAASVATTISILNKGSGAITLAAGQEGQIKYLVNINAFGIVVTPSSTLGTNTATLAQYGAVQYVYLSGEWRAFAGQGCTVA